MALSTESLGRLPGFRQIIRGGEMPILRAFCCDLLSLVISRAPGDCAWITVMGNVNTVAVATLCDVSAIVVAENMPADPDMLTAAEREGISIYLTALPVFEAALAIHEAAGHAL